MCVSFLTGTAIRHCSDEKGWLLPELFNCTAVTFAHLKKLVSTPQNKVFGMSLTGNNPSVRHETDVVIRSILH